MPKEYDWRSDRPVEKMGEPRPQCDGCGGIIRGIVNILTIRRKGRVRRVPMHGDCARKADLEGTVVGSEKER